MRRGASSEAATIRRRDAASSDLLSALAIAVATSSVNFSRRSSVSGGSASWVDETLTVPHVRPSTMIGLATVETMPSRPGAALTGPRTRDQSIPSTRTELPIRWTCAEAKTSSISHRVPVGTIVTLLEATAMTADPSKRPIPAKSAPSSAPASRATAPKISLAGRPCATIVATRRSAACSAARCASASRESALATARATSSAGACALRGWGRSGSTVFPWTTTTVQR